MVSPLSPATNAVYSSQSKSEAQNAGLFDRSSAQDIAVTGTDDDSIGAARGNDFVDRFAAMLQEDVDQQMFDHLAKTSYFERMEDLIEDFALRLGQSNSSPIVSQAVILIHENRR